MAKSRMPRVGRLRMKQIHTCQVCALAGDVAEAVASDSWIDISGFINPFIRMKGLNLAKMLYIA